MSEQGEHELGDMVTIAPEQASSTQSMPLAPEPGRIVNVRGSTWAVADVRRQGLPRSPADEGTAGLTHVVSLQSLEEDRLGEELAVVWELEVGHTVAPDQGLPDAVTADGFDDPNTLAAYVVGQPAWLDAATAPMSMWRTTSNRPRTSG